LGLFGFFYYSSAIEAKGRSFFKLFSILGNGIGGFFLELFLASITDKVYFGEAVERVHKFHIINLGLNIASISVFK